MSSPSPGWYTDPDDPAQLRYWNGRSWTESRSLAAEVPLAAPAGVPAQEAPVAPAVVPQPAPVPAWILTQRNIYEEAVDLDQVLTPDERKAYGQHTLNRFPTWLVVVLHFLTLGIFTFIYQGLKLSKLPLVRNNDFGAGKGIGYNFIPFYNYYWNFRFVNAINDRLNFQLRLRGDRKRSPRGLGIACNVLWVIPLYGFVVTWIVLMPIMSAYMQSATNRLLDLREHEAATATGPPRLSRTEARRDQPTSQGVPLQALVGRLDSAAVGEKRRTQPPVMEPAVEI